MTRLENVGYSVIAPSVLFGELEIKRSNQAKDKLPDYAAPSLVVAGQSDPKPATVGAAHP